ncbi:uncharacterized membrane protein YbaN (DUF454 family) [Streptococcus rupicaprae]|uniref:Uncharacterized membrane protein YbaN (DUF454 family) n=1 Tax=Streptococcus rupicaprae TaxID=759619 RepID=A0ABV2FFJ4_9STRE
MKKLILLICGTISLIIGLLGILLPVVPTTPLLLLAGTCYAKSSERFEKWLKQTKVYQFYVADYAETKSISKKRKKQIIVQIYLLMALSIYLAPLLPVKFALAALTVFITYYLFKVIPDK